jgi:UPF0176 protein
VLTAEYRVHSRERLTQKFPAHSEPEVNPAIQILFEDEALVVLHKPAPLPMHPGGRYNRNTLEYLLDATFQPYHLRPAHRLDANTTGLVICAKTRRIASQLQPQFQRGEVEKVYLAKIQGNPSWDNFICDTPIRDTPGQTGSRDIDLENGLPAQTSFQVLARFPEENTTLLEARPHTGRTNQIRVHLWSLDFPICGDPTYLPQKAIGLIQTLAISDPSLCLHAWRMTILHPTLQKKITFEAENPLWTKTITSSDK